MYIQKMLYPWMLLFRWNSAVGQRAFNQNCCVSKIKISSVFLIVVYSPLNISLTKHEYLLRHFKYWYKLHAHLKKCIFKASKILCSKLVQHNSQFLSFVFGFFRIFEEEKVQFYEHGIESDDSRINCFILL